MIHHVRWRVKASRKQSKVKKLLEAWRKLISFVVEAEAQSIEFRAHCKMCDARRRPRAIVCTHLAVPFWINFPRGFALFRFKFSQNKKEDRTNTNFVSSCTEQTFVIPFKLENKAWLINFICLSFFVYLHRTTKKVVVCGVWIRFALVTRRNFFLGAKADAKYVSRATATTNNKVVWCLVFHLIFFWCLRHVKRSWGPRLYGRK